MEVTYSARSHIGSVREKNEDNLYVAGVTLPHDICERPFFRPFSIDGKSASPAIFAVCDGMGGESNGEIASLLAVETLMNLDERIKANTQKKWDDVIQSYVDDVDNAIEHNEKNHNKRMGTTLALIVITRKGIQCFNVGDSSIFNLQRNKFAKITNDHTLAGGNKLTRCIGIGEARTIESYPMITGKCRILICSDGLTDMVNLKSIEHAMRFYKHTSDAANAMLETALDNGGNDNVTLIVADINVYRAPLLHVFMKK